MSFCFVNLYLVPSGRSSMLNMIIIVRKLIIFMTRGINLLLISLRV